MILLNDHAGNRETLFYNPTMQIHDDGSVVILPTDIWVSGVKYAMPMYAGDGEEIWADYRNQSYSDNIKDCADNAFLVVKKKSGVYTITRYRNPKGLVYRIFKTIYSLVRFRHEIS